MNRYAARFTFSLAALLLLSSAVYAGPLDDYYLQQFGEKKSLQLQKAILSVAPAAQEAAKCGMPLKHALRHDWQLLELSTQKVLAKQLAYPVLSGTAQTQHTQASPSGKFMIHYTTDGVDAVPSPVWVDTVANIFDEVAGKYSALQWPLAPSLPYNVYLRDLASLPGGGYYGLTNSDIDATSASYPYAYTSWIEIDNNFTDSIYNPSTYQPIDSLRITAAHEYHHAIQYGYSYYFDVWYAEATSTWMEDELYGNVNQLYSYIHPWFTQSRLSLDISESTSTGGGYGRWIFNRYLAENHTVSIINSVWQKLATLNPASNPVNTAGDIQMAPVLDTVLSSTSYNSTLSADFFGFAKQVYTRNWLPPQTDIALIPTYIASVKYSSYPVSSPPTVTLPHYSFAYFTFTPSITTPNLTIYLAKTAGIQATVFIKENGITKEVAPSGTSYTISGFNTTDEVVLLIANSSTVDGHMASFSTDGNNQPVTDPTSGSVYVPPTPISSGGSGGACFIATAAYGSYLHPQVQLLRNFRDEYLLTNTPGRTFVTWYYRYSPPLADFIARHPTLRVVTRLLLTPLVVAVAQPLISAVVLLLFIGVTLLTKQYRLRSLRQVAIKPTHQTR